MKRFLIATVIVLAFVLCSALVVPLVIEVLYPSATKVAIHELIVNPKKYNGKLVNVHGFLIKNIGAFFGNKYSLCNIPPQKTPLPGTFDVALSGEPEMLEPYVSYTFDGRDFGRTAFSGEVCVVGTFRWTEVPPTDSPQSYIDVSKISTGSYV